MIQNIFEYIDYLEANYIERIAFQYCVKSEIYQVSYRQYIDDVKKFALYLREKYEDTEGKHIAVLSRDTYRMAVCISGIIYAKAVAVPLNIEENEQEIISLIESADVECIFGDPLYKPKEKIGQVAEWNNIYITDESCKVEDLDKSVDSKLPCVILFSSGTVGRRKAIMLSQEALFGNMIYSMRQLEDDNAVQKKQTRVFDMNPLYHVGGLVATITNNGLGAMINLCTSVKYIYRDLQQMDSDCARVTPAVLSLWGKRLKKEGAQWLGSIKMIICGAAFVNTDLFGVFSEFGITVVQAYGLSEIGGCVTLNMSDKIKSVGKAGEGVQIEIRNREVCVKSQSIMSGYYKDIEATRQAIQDGWLYTGDLGYLDEEGYLYLTGRKKNLIILPGGENVSPEELEDLLYKNPDIEEVIVKEAAQKICAEIYSKKDKWDAIKSYIMELNRSLPYYKRITDVKFKEERFEKTASDKIKRNQ